MEISINWKGPYLSIEDIPSEDGNGLYMLTGRRPRQRNDPEIQYFGITEGTYRNRFNDHDAISSINRDLGIWLGEITRPKRYNRTHLEKAEMILISYINPNLNIQHNREEPLTDEKITVISNWFRTDGIARQRRLPIYRNFPYKIHWNRSEWEYEF